jgi:hypothetical protein
MSTILGTVGIGNGGIGNQQIYATTGTGGHPLMNATAMYPQIRTQQSIDVGMRINKVENGFIVEIGNYEGGLVTKYIAKDMNEVRDLITSDIVTRRMEGM